MAFTVKRLGYHDLTAMNIPPRDVGLLTALAREAIKAGAGADWTKILNKHVVRFETGLKHKEEHSFLRVRK